MERHTVISVSVAIVGLAYIITVAQLPVVSQGFNSTFISWNWTSTQTIPGDPLWYVIDALLAKLVSNVPLTTGYYYKTNFSCGNQTAYGEMKCNQALIATDCWSCTSYLKSVVWGDTAHAIGLTAKLEDCVVHYENFEF
ncbi:hypothetical protein O6H91_01G046400 [Diphasiastrum complanatum]|uniref:Uncharacterized protein n=1 Tax=Diphasiastrum complanatum TaxID=34168 RepID=A0ACC2EQV4_DIPCM|nr:hypothetical protein O6H91_01G046400 [Diphasiastrum complanatum]